MDCGDLFLGFISRNVQEESTEWVLDDFCHFFKEKVLKIFKFHFKFGTKFYWKLFEVNVFQDGVCFYFLTKFLDNLGVNLLVSQKFMFKISIDPNQIFKIAVFNNFSPKFFIRVQKNASHYHWKPQSLFHFQTHCVSRFSWIFDEIVGLKLVR